jgi:hypothetical protein
MFPDSEAASPVSRFGWAHAWGEGDIGTPAAGDHDVLTSLGARDAF